jgi:hypothetical protein
MWGSQETTVVMGEPLTKPPSLAPAPNKEANLVGAGCQLSPEAEGFEGTRVRCLCTIYISVSRVS